MAACQKRQIQRLPRNSSWKHRPKYTSVSTLLLSLKYRNTPRVVTPTTTLKTESIRGRSPSVWKKKKMFTLRASHLAALTANYCGHGRRQGRPDPFSLPNIWRKCSPSQLQTRSWLHRHDRAESRARRFFFKKTKRIKRSAMQRHTHKRRDASGRAGSCVRVCVCMCVYGCVWWKVHIGIHTSDPVHVGRHFCSPGAYTIKLQGME